MCILLQCHYARLASEWSGENIDYWVIRTEEKILIVKRALSSPLGSFPTCRKSSIHSVWLERLLRSLWVRCFEWSDITECKDEMQVDERWDWQLDSGWGASSRFVFWCSGSGMSEWATWQIWLFSAGHRWVSCLPCLCPLDLLLGIGFPMLQDLYRKSNPYMMKLSFETPLCLGREGFAF